MYLYMHLEALFKYFEEGWWLNIQFAFLHIIDIYPKEKLYFELLQFGINFVAEVVAIMQITGRNRIRDFTRLFSISVNSPLTLDTYLTDASEYEVQN